ncbi:hypothetical protein [Sphingomonas sp.]|uniref:hypothetical protein n=1 Tax=Sphingomonas sp. TaxID=28214 RepID=UPI001B0E40E7|nr:hypothetical protein [Sphingomonas sp.]MBO9714345.1 hypothetical protein [Sphingomonas sp.]
MQRVRVGITGLALVLVMIGLGSVVLTSANRDDPVEAIGASNAAVVANITDGNVMVAKTREEPLAELGVAPSAGTPETPNGADGSKR